MFTSPLILLACKESITASRILVTPLLTSKATVGVWFKLVLSAIQNLSALTANAVVLPDNSLAVDIKPKPLTYPLLEILTAYLPCIPFIVEVLVLIAVVLLPTVVLNDVTVAAWAWAVEFADAAVVLTAFNCDIVANTLVPVPPVTIDSKLVNLVACDVVVPFNVLTVEFNELCSLSVANLLVVPSASNTCDSRLVILFKSNVILPEPCTCNVSNAATLDVNDVDAEPLTVLSKDDVNVSNAVILVPWSVIWLTPFCVITFSSTKTLPSTVVTLAIWFCNDVDNCDVSILLVAAAISVSNLSKSILACVTSVPDKSIIVPDPDDTVEEKSLISIDAPVGGAVVNVITLCVLLMVVLKWVLKD